VFGCVRVGYKPAIGTGRGQLDPAHHQAGRKPELAGYPANENRCEQRNRGQRQSQNRTSASARNATGPARPSPPPNRPEAEASRLP